MCVSVPSTPLVFEMPPAMTSATWSNSRTRTTAMRSTPPATYLYANLLEVEDTLIAGDAVVTGEVSRSVIGAGARVAGDVRDSVIWPGSVVAKGEKLSRCIRAGDVTVPVPGL